MLRPINLLQGNRRRDAANGATSCDVMTSSGRRSTDVLVGNRLREVRKRRRLTLGDVESISRGEFKTSVLGAYERGERGVSVSRLLRLAELYGVRPSELLPDQEPRGDDDSVRRPRYPSEAVL